MTPEQREARRAYYRTEKWRAYHRAYKAAHRARSARVVVDDVDPVAVHLAAAGDRSITLNLGERRAVVARLTKQGISAARIAEQLGVARRTVERDRTALRTPTTDQEAA